MDAGYDLVIGHGPHVVQPVEVIDGVPVLYSLGNFVFGTSGRFTERFPGYGLVATVRLEGGSIGAVEPRCILTDNERIAFQPRPCPETEAVTVLASLHPSLELSAGVARLELPR